MRFFTGYLSLSAVSDLLGRPNLASRWLACAGVMLLGAPLVALAAGQDAAPAKVVLKYKALVGSTERVRRTAQVTLSSGGEETMSLTIKEVDKETVTKVDATTGDVTLESRTESSEMKLGDGSSPEGAQPRTAVETFAVHPNKILLSFASTEPGADQSDASIRIAQGSTIIFPDTPVTVGDKWSHDFKADAGLKTPDGHAEFEIVGMTKVGGVDAYKIKMTYKETGAKTLTGSGVHVIEAASGDEISSDSTFEGLDVVGQTAKATVHFERLEGGPLSGARPAA